MASFNFTPVLVPTGEPISTAIASIGATAGASFLSGSAQSKGSKAANLATDLDRQANEVRNLGQEKINAIAAVDPNAPELREYAAFVDRKIVESPGPGNEQGDVVAEGDRILSLVRARGPQQGTAQNLADSLNNTLTSLVNSLGGVLTERDQTLQGQLNAGLSGLKNQNDQQLSVVKDQLAGVEAKALDARATAIEQGRPMPAPNYAPVAIVAGVVILAVILLRRK